MNCIVVQATFRSPLAQFLNHNRKTILPMNNKCTVIITTLFTQLISMYIQCVVINRNKQSIVLKVYCRLTQFDQVFLRLADVYFCKCAVPYGCLLSFVKLAELYTFISLFWPLGLQSALIHQRLSASQSCFVCYRYTNYLSKCPLMLKYC